MKRKMFIGKIIKELRLAHNFTLDKLASLTYMSPRALIRLEQNLTQPTLGTIFLLADAFGIKASELVRLIEENSEMTLIQD